MIPRLFPHVFALALVSVTGAQAVRPAAEAAAAAAATPAPNEKPAPYVLKNKSVFVAAAVDQRAPFWPIGWTKRKPMSQVTSVAKVVEAPKAVLDEKSIKLTSILLGNPSLAIINGRTYSEGEFLRMPRTAPVAGAPAGAPTGGSVPSHVRVYRINDGNVMLQNQDQLITVALQRPELMQRSGGGDLLLEDRP